MSEIKITRFANRWKPNEFIHTEAGTVTAGPIEPGWLSSQWQIEPVADTPYVRFKNLWKSEDCLHIETGIPEAGPVGPGWLSAQWYFEAVPATQFARIRNRWPSVRYAHVESGPIDIGQVGPGWLSAHWLLEKVPSTTFVRVRNRFRPNQGLHIENGFLSFGPVEPGMLSAQWSVEQIAGSSFVRFKNRWKPDQFFHIENGKAEAGPAGPGWLSAQWLLEPVQGTSFVRLKNRWEFEPYLHIERGVLETGVIEPGWLSAQWLTGAFRSKTIPLSLFQRKFDEFFNHREKPLFKFRLHGEHYGKSELTIFYEDLLKGTLEPFRDPVDLREDGEDLEIALTGLPNPNFHFSDLNTDSVTVNMTPDRPGVPPEIEVRVRFETKWEELKINNFPNVDFDGLNITIRLPIGCDIANGLVGLDSFVDLVEQAMREVKLEYFLGSGSPSSRDVRLTVEFRGKVFTRQGPAASIEPLKGALKKDLFKEFVNADASVDAPGLPDGVVAGKIESTLNTKVREALVERLRDGSKSGWTPWRSVSEGSTTPGGHVIAIMTDESRIALFLADPNGGVYTSAGSVESDFGSWTSVSEGGTIPGGHISAVSTDHDQVSLFLADPNGGVYTTSGSTTRGWRPWTSVSEGSTIPGGHVTAVATHENRIALFLADRSGGVYTTSGSAAHGWRPWTSVSEGSTIPGGHITAVATDENRIALFLADPSGGVYTTSGSPAHGWGPWMSVSEGRTIPGGHVAAVVTGYDQVSLFLADPNGGVYTTSGSAARGWRPWTSVSEGSTIGGAPIAAALTDQNRVALFLADPNGGIYTTIGSAAGDWRPWKHISQGRSTPGANVAGVAIGQNRFAVFVADPTGGVFTSRMGPVFHSGINRRLTRLFVGGEFRVLGVWNDGQALTIDYLLGNQLDPFPESPQPPLDPGPLSEIEHIVVLMMENRSFDHMLGYLSLRGGRTDVEGLRGGEKNIYEGIEYPSFPLTGTQFNVSPCHGFECVATQLAQGSMNGFVEDFAPRALRAAENGVDIKPGDIMGYYDAAQVPVYDALAREFLVCDHWFCSHPGGTFPNRFYGLAGRLDRDANGNPEPRNPHLDDFSPVFTKTIFDHLTDGGIEWRYYEHGYCFLRLFDRYTFDTTNIVDAHDPELGFFAAAENGSLKSVSFIDPDFIEVPPGTDDHAPADVAAGQHLIGKVVNALMNGPLWNKTMLIITYDEHGGFYDHVTPPPAPAVSGIDRYGVRVPALVVSPWVERGAVSHVLFDHTSILKTIARCFLHDHPPDMGERMNGANDLSMVLQSSIRREKPSIPVPEVPASSVALPAESPADGEADADDLLRRMRFLFFAE